MTEPRYVYIDSRYTRSTFYTGVTNNLARRLKDHPMGKGSSFTPKYNLFYLVYWEEVREKRQALARERQMKNWHRDWKITLIRKANPEMRDLTSELPSRLQGMDPE